MRNLLVVRFLWLAGCSGGPKTFAGDKVETRACRWCNGSGVDDSGEGPSAGGACPGCRGAKQLQVVIPGPKHPALVKGVVRDLSKLPGGPDDVVVLMEAREPLKPITGALGGARLRFEKDGTTQEISSSSAGRFKILLEPGHYQVHLSAAGFADLDQPLEVAPLQEPIWAERAHLKTPEKDADTTYFDVSLTPK